MAAVSEDSRPLHAAVDLSADSTVTTVLTVDEGEGVFCGSNNELSASAECRWMSAAVCR